jgi:hypothetical protein
VVELLAAVQQLLQHLDQVFAHIGDAADAAVGHLEDLLLRTQHQVGIDVDLAELVFDDRDAVAVPGAQDVVQQRGLAGAQEAREDGDRHGAVWRSWCHGLCCCKACSTCSGLMG